jgi:hypothetical protein
MISGDDDGSDDISVCKSLGDVHFFAAHLNSGTAKSGRRQTFAYADTDVQ